MHSSGLCLQNILHNSVAVTGGEREFGIHRRDTGAENECDGAMDDSGVIVLIQALGDAKISNKWVMNTPSHSDFALAIK